MLRLAKLSLALLPVAGGLAQTTTTDPPPDLPPDVPDVPVTEPEIPVDIPAVTPVPVPDQYVIQVERGRAGAVAKKLEASGGIQVLDTYQCSDVFEGLTVLAKDGQTMDEVKHSSGAEAKRIWNSVNYAPAAPIRKHPRRRDTDAHGRRKRNVKKRDLTPGGYSFASSINADKAHAAGFTGSGVKVAVIDSGLYFDHPAFQNAGACFGQPGCKVAGGYDFIGDDFPNSSPWEDGFPNDGFGHGSHVAGIIAGNTADFKGIAPDATLYIYRVFSNHGVTGNDAILKSFCAAANDDVDVINLSLGYGHGFTPDNDASAQLASDLVNQGVVVHFSAMNNGDYGPFTISDAPVHPDITMVASTDVPLRKFLLGGPEWNHTVVASDSQGNDASFSTTFVRLRNETWSNEWPADWPLVPLTLDTTDDGQACSPLDPATFPGFPAIVVLKEATACDYATQVANTNLNGNFILVMYSSDDTKPPVSKPFAQGRIVYTISKSAGERIVNLFAEGGTARVDWSLPAPFVQVDPHGGFPSQFTSWGPTFDLDVTKPDVAAPGGNILSVGSNGGWTEMSGTSMSAPMLSGVAALFISAHGGRSVWGNQTAYMIKKRLIASARSLSWRTIRPLPLQPPAESTFRAPTPQIGAGLVDAWHVVNATTQLSFDNFALSDLARFKPNWDVDIENRGDTPVTYTFSLEPAGAFNMQSTSNTGYLASLEEITPKSIVPGVTFPQGTFTVQPGQKQKATFQFSPPSVSAADQSLLPIYSGNVVIEASNGERFVVPYTGAAFDLRMQLRGKMFSGGYPKQISGPQGQDIDEYHTYNFNLDPAVASYPNVTMHLKYGTAEVRWDIFQSGWEESQWQYPPVSGQNGYIGSATYHTGGAGLDIFDPAQGMDKESVWNFPLYNHFRTRLPPNPLPSRQINEVLEAGHFMWFGKLDHGSYIQPGQYKMRFAALVPNGDPTVAADWTVWQTPEITILDYQP